MREDAPSSWGLAIEWIRPDFFFFKNLPTNSAPGDLACLIDASSTRGQKITPGLGGFQMRVFFLIGLKKNCVFLFSRPNVWDVRDGLASFYRKPVGCVEQRATIRHLKPAGEYLIFLINHHLSTRE